MSKGTNGQLFKTPLTAISRLSKRGLFPGGLTDSATTLAPGKNNSKDAWQRYWDAEYQRQTGVYADEARKRQEDQS